jgi:hypothetical protein
MEGTTGTTQTGGGTGGTAAQSGAQSLGWRAGLPTELQNHDWLKGFTKVGDFATAALGFKERAEHAVVLPSEKSTPEEIQAFNRALGVPEKEDDYQFELPSIPEGIPQNGNDALAPVLKKLALQAGISKKQAKAFVEPLYAQFIQQAVTMKKAMDENKSKAETEKKAMMEKAEADLRKEWTKPGEFENNIKAAGKIARLLGGEELVQELDETRLVHSPRLLKALTRAAQFIDADKLEKGEGAGPASAPAPGSAESRRFTYPWMKEFYGSVADSE